MTSIFNITPIVNYSFICATAVACEECPDTAPMLQRDFITQTNHREKLGSDASRCLDRQFPRPWETVEPGVPACVAKKVPRSKWNTPKAKVALDKEWNKLRTHKHPKGNKTGVWDESTVCEAKEAREYARKMGEVHHYGRSLLMSRVGKKACW